jgi:signal transduction histidine kinase
VIDLRRADVTVRDLPAALLLAVVAVTPVLEGKGTQLGNIPDHPFDVGTVLVAGVLECLPLAVRRRWPAACLALVSLGFALDQLLGYHTVGGTALPIAVLSAGVHLERRRRLVLALTAGAYVPLAVALERLGPGEGIAGFVTFFVALAIAWAIGAWFRQTRVAEEERRRRIAENTRAAERTRIARELHDVVTHHVTAMVVQTEAARYLTGSPERLDQTLTAITDPGRQAISDLRQMLDLLNPLYGDDTAGGDIAALVDQTRRAGQPVEFSEDGGRTENAVAYRVVREALTNALKYDHGAPTAVRVRRGAKEISVTVGSDGSGSRSASPGGSGRGLAGLRERVEALGGQFTAGPRDGGGFVVEARIPAGSPS